MPGEGEWTLAETADLSVRGSRDKRGAFLFWRGRMVKIRIRWYRYMTDEEARAFADLLGAAWGGQVRMEKTAPGGKTRRCCHFPWCSGKRGNHRMEAIRRKIRKSLYKAGRRDWCSWPCCFCA